jgi:TetR/AcrR family transcriptional regulator, transcriptional repressor for nem operon
MARVREFDPAEALVGAMQVFWRRGFTDTSMDDIVKETGVSRYGLYGEFGNKKGLLVAAMGQYADQMGDLLMADLRKPDAGLEAILGYWQSIREFASEPNSCPGCLLVNIASEVAPHDPEIAAEIQRLHAHQVELIASAIRNGQNDGDIPINVDDKGAARMMVTLSHGMALMAGTGAALLEFEGAIDAAISVLQISEKRS